MKILYCYLLLAMVFSKNAFSQIVEATWVSGDNATNQPGIYGVKGVASISNKPGARYRPSSWIDADGNFWLMGGEEGFFTTAAHLGDLWRYNPLTSEWTWVSGDNTKNQPAIYGTKGIPSSLNKPGARSGAANWVDGDGNFWLMGGQNATNGLLNDLWRYNPSTNEWTWVHGDNTPDQLGIYGIKGVASSLNKPGSRYGGSSCTDAEGNFWLMGGNGRPFLSFLSDLWKYNPSTNEWTWISGDNIGNQSGIFGSKGIPSSSNKPGGTREAVMEMDVTGNLMLMGGMGYASGNSEGLLNVLWKFSPSSNNWTWVSGDNSINQPGIYGAKGLSSPMNKPGARVGSTGWIDVAGNLWLMGGSEIGGYRNDLWNYNPSTDEWTWIHGPSFANDAGLYGTKGIPSPCNNPGAKYRPASWLDPAGDFWVMAGSGNNNGSFNDLWKIDVTGNTEPCPTPEPDPCQPAIAVVIPDAQAISSGGNFNTVYIGYTLASQLTLNAQATGGNGSYSYNWSTGGSTASSLVIDAATLSVGIHSYTVTITDGNGCTGTASKQIIVKDIRCGNDNRKVNICHITDNDQSHTNELCIDEDGVPAHLAKGCKLGECVSGGSISISRPDVLENNKATLTLRVAPNPSKNFFTVIIQGNTSAEPISLKVIDLSGRLVEVKNNLSVGQSLQLGHKYQAGTYIIELSQGSKKVHNKIVKSGN